MIDDIKDPSFLRQLNSKKLKELASEIRSFIIQNTSKTGGHLSSNLGVVELTIALLYVFNQKDDKILFDVGHQSYAYKILTGRKDLFNTLRQDGGLSGFISYKESLYDKWESGHAGTAISALSGFLYGNFLNGTKGKVVSLVGDASIINGTSFEALNYLVDAPFRKDAIIILNDNEMSISKSVGGLSRMLSSIRGTRVLRGLKKVSQKIFPKIIHKIFGRVKRSIKAFLQTRNIFEDLGYVYLGPIDGHDIESIIYNLEKAKSFDRPVLVHALTKKGKGYKKAEVNPSYYHGIGSFDVETGIAPSNFSGLISFSELVSEIITEFTLKEAITVVMPAMTLGSHFTDFSLKYPHLLLDVGIAEEHAAVMAAAVAISGQKVFLPFYATFSQRAFDQILNDIARPNLHVVIGIDRAGIVAEDGATHQGIYDLAMFFLMPNVKIAIPFDAQETVALFSYAFFKQKSPFVIRYPKDTTKELLDYSVKEIDETWTILKKGQEINIISYGRSLNLLLELVSKYHIDANIINARFIKPLDQNALRTIFFNELPILIYEESATPVLFYEILKFKELNGYETAIYNMALDATALDVGSYPFLLQKSKMDPGSVKDQITAILKEKSKR